MSEIRASLLYAVRLSTKCTVATPTKQGGCSSAKYAHLKQVACSGKRFPAALEETRAIMANFFAAYESGLLCLTIGDDPPDGGRPGLRADSLPPEVVHGDCISQSMEAQGQYCTHGWNCAS